MFLLFFGLGLPLLVWRWSILDLLISHASIYGLYLLQTREPVSGSRHKNNIFMIYHNLDMSLLISISSKTLFSLLIGSWYFLDTPLVQSQTLDQYQFLLRDYLVGLGLYYALYKRYSGQQKTVFHRLKWILRPILTRTLFNGLILTAFQTVFHAIVCYPAMNGLVSLYRGFGQELSTQYTPKQRKSFEEHISLLEQRKDKMQHIYDFYTAIKTKKEIRKQIFDQEGGFQRCFVFFKQEMQQFTAAWQPKQEKQEVKAGGLVGDPTISPTKHESVLLQRKSIKKTIISALMEEPEQKKPKPLFFQQTQDQAVPSILLGRQDHVDKPKHKHLLSVETFNLLETLSFVVERIYPLHFLLGHTVVREITLTKLVISSAKEDKFGSVHEQVPQVLEILVKLYVQIEKYCHDKSIQGADKHPVVLFQSKEHWIIPKEPRALLQQLEISIYQQIPL
ncbi:hypothetical protein EDD86DRAFT_247002 [Gorgonomyces haynaldii]|nr:hypothetical protein EDD86DRAFT_247002 [Gorgonomyces haynaldii]